MGIEPINDGNGNDTKIIKTMPLPPQCERAFKANWRNILTFENQTKTLKKNYLDINLLSFDFSLIVINFLT